MIPVRNTHHSRIKLRPVEVARRRGTEGRCGLEDVRLRDIPSAWYRLRDPLSKRAPYRRSACDCEVRWAILQIICQFLPTATAMTSREKDIRNALSHLLPTTSSLPSILVSTSSSIFDKSRSKVPLRPDEEPARVWLASYLAAERFYPI